MSEAAIIYYHKNDHDGHLSGEIVRRWYDEKGMKTHLFPMDYGDQMDWRELEDLIRRYGRRVRVYFLDWTPPISAFDTYAMEFGGLTYWIDHHQTAIQAEEKYERLKALWGKRVEGDKAACLLTWEYFREDYLERYGENVPFFIQLLSDYDAWNDHLPNWQDEILPFHYYMMREETDPSISTALWDYLFDQLYDPELNDPSCMGTIIERMLSVGKAIMQYQQHQDNVLARRLAQEVEFDGFKAVVMNNGRQSSQQFKEIYDPNKHHLMIVWRREQNFYRVSFYTKRIGIDVSQIAKNYKGGGHPKAAGCQVQFLSIVNGVMTIDGGLK